MALPKHKTKIVCTIGPACSSQEIMEQMIRAGMSAARLNFSHGDFDSHRAAIRNLRAAAAAAGRRLAILGDLPGPKMRIGRLQKEPLLLETADKLTLTTEEILGDANRISVSFQQLPQVVRPKDKLFLNDGIIEIEVETVAGKEVLCRVLVGGELLSKKGLNLPNIDLGISAFTDRDRECLAFAKEQGLDAVSQSFVESAADIEAVRVSAAEMGYHPFIIAKIERAKAKDNLEGILEAADGIMIARGDLGVELPIQQIAIAQKYLMLLANRAGKPVITATQMLESMIDLRRPTRAEATDVANAILDGTDCVMLSAESAIGRYPVDAAAMLGKIAAAVEPFRRSLGHDLDPLDTDPECATGLTDVIVCNVQSTLERISPAFAIVPTRSGYTARQLARFKPAVWIAAVSNLETTCQQLLFTYGVYPRCEPDHPEDWKAYARKLLAELGVKGSRVVLTEGPSSRNPEANHRMEILDLER